MRHRFAVAWLAPSLLGLAVATVGGAPALATVPAPAAGTAPAARALPRPDHVVIVVLENKRYDHVIGHPRMPYLTWLSRYGANLTQAYAETHPSQPNYLALYSGSTQGVTDNSCRYSFTGRPNLGRQLIDAGYSFAGFSEGLPAVGYNGCHSGRYVRRHNPWVGFDNVPAASNQPFSAFPSNYARLPTVSFVVPDLCDDMHDCPKANGDRWLRAHLDGYVRWAAVHNSLLVVTFDEDNRTGGNHIATIVCGQHVRPGQYGGHVDHYSILRTIQDLYGLPPLGMAAHRSPIVDIWTG